MVQFRPGDFGSILERQPVDPHLPREALGLRGGYFRAKEINFQRSPKTWQRQRPYLTAR